MKKVLIILLCVLVFASCALAQTYAAGTTGGIVGVDKLGAHANGGRGCAGCHAPHSGGYGAGGTAGTGTTPDPYMGNIALWGEDWGPLYGQTLYFGSNAGYPITLPTSAQLASNPEEPEILGVMTCLSCHDGNIAKGNMMTNQSYEQKLGLLPKGAGGQTLYGSTPIPTLLGNDGTGAGNYANDHPIGPNATLKAVGISGRLSVTTCGTAPNTYACLQINSAKDTNGAYQAFVNHYGAPQILPGRTSFIVIPDGAATADTAYVVCTTCHTPHSMYTYNAGSNPGNTIAGNTSGTYPTYFFLNAPYNPGSQPGVNQASSATQFCRQCHFTGAGGSNEGAGITTVTTAF